MSTRDLIERIREKRDSKLAQEELYAIVRTALLERLRGKIPAKARSRLDAEDVLHTAFLKGISSLDRFQPRGDDSFVAWIYRIAKNHILDVVQRRSVAAVRFADDPDGSGPRQSQIRSKSPRATVGLANHEFTEKLLKKLSPQDEDLVRKHLYGGKSFEEIARAEGRTPGAVQRAFSRAVQRLRELTKDGGA